MIEREPERAQSIVRVVADINLDPRVRCVAKVDPQASPQGTVARMADQADMGPQRSEEGPAPQAISSFASYTDIG